MRTLALVLLVACSSKGGGGGGGGDDTGIDAPTRSPEPCDESVDSYCARVQCDGTPSTARGNASYCPANEITCLDIDLIVSTAADTGVNLYYENGSLLAIEDVTIAGVHCVAGPPLFAPPTCGSDMGTKLAVCP